MIEQILIEVSNSWCDNSHDNMPVEFGFRIATMYSLPQTLSALPRCVCCWVLLLLAPTSYESTSNKRQVLRSTVSALSFAVRRTQCHTLPLLCP